MRPELALSVIKRAIRKEFLGREAEELFSG